MKEETKLASVDLSKIYQMRKQDKHHKLISLSQGRYWGWLPQGAGKWNYHYQDKLAQERGALSPATLMKIEAFLNVNEGQAAGLPLRQELS